MSCYSRPQSLSRARISRHPRDQNGGLQPFSTETTLSFPGGTPRAAVSRVRRPALLLFKCKFNFPFQRQSALKSGRVAHTRNAPLTGVSPKSGRPFCHSFVRFPGCFRWRGISTGISDARSTSATKSMRLLLDIGRIVPFSPDGKRGKCHPVQPSPRVYTPCY